ncbi:DedA family protein [Buchnera aphidicola]|uniref:DedA family protein n=1 Tax=Buchnera aphidicola TaxID=9 RepID=UPI0031B6EAA5
MKYYLINSMTLITHHLYFFVFIISFLESIAFIGLFLPGLILMGGIGTLIGNGKLNFYYTWLLSFLGCYLGDFFSYFLGRIGRKKIKKTFFFQKYKNFIKKITKYLNKYNILTIIIGKFIGPIRPLIPITSGILKFSFSKFLILNFFSCIFWPIIYFFPGIFTYLTVNSINSIQNPKIYIFFIILFFLNIFTFLWILYKWIFLLTKKKNFKIYKYNITLKIGKILIIIFTSIIFFEIIFLILQPQTFVLYKIFKKIL